MDKENTIKRLFRRENTMHNNDDFKRLDVPKIRLNYGPH